MTLDTTNHDTFLEWFTNPDSHDPKLREPHLDLATGRVIGNDGTKLIAIKSIFTSKTYPFCNDSYPIWRASINDAIDAGSWIQLSVPCLQIILDNIPQVKSGGKIRYDDFHLVSLNGAFFRPALLWPLVEIAKYFQMSEIKMAVPQNTSISGAYVGFPAIDVLLLGSDPGGTAGKYVIEKMEVSKL